MGKPGDKPLASVSSHLSFFCYCLPLAKANQNPKGTRVLFTGCISGATSPAHSLWARMEAGLKQEAKVSNRAMK